MPADVRLNLRDRSRPEGVDSRFFGFVIFFLGAGGWKATWPITDGCLDGPGCTVGWPFQLHAAVFLFAVANFFLFGGPSQKKLMTTYNSMFLRQDLNARFTCFWRRREY
jgi:hypothetical protein